MECHLLENGEGEGEGCEKVGGRGTRQTVSQLRMWLWCARWAMWGDEYRYCEFSWVLLGLMVFVGRDAEHSIQWSLIRAGAFMASPTFSTLMPTSQVYMDDLSTRSNN
ncbi:hypothetical protein K504DRAFT_224591 [Pleomassaria siparia CBS 279.74]|uniref:Uncharacterized protein n=1 Tax=Pleomassaria siparia CBS 279.74 TaxID=1314801 RepID=A0A6G1KFF8_9PLEO|nr:hypothetical protein K504DRAFT_224591 [Pleomassaria siparia CBS 279.74]